MYNTVAESQVEGDRKKIRPVQLTHNTRRNEPSSTVEELDIQLCVDPNVRVEGTIKQLSNMRRVQIDTEEQCR